MKPGAAVPFVIAAVSALGAIAGGVWMSANPALGRGWILVVILAVVALAAGYLGIWRIQQASRGGSVQQGIPPANPNPRGGVDYGRPQDGPHNPER